MARTHLKVIRGRHGSYQVHTREISSEGKAPESIDPAVIVRRAVAADLAREVIDAGYEIKLMKVEPRQEKGAAYKQPSHWMLRIALQRPITAGDYKKVEQPAIDADLMKPGAKVADDVVKIRTFSFLTETSKMGCFSFNLPAGPTFQGGTCPASALGFMFLDAAEIRKQQTKTTALPISVPDYICNGCVVGDTRVLVRNRGLVPVSELEQEGESFEVWSGKTWRQAKAVFTGHKPVFELTTSWGAQLQLTADHQVLTQDRGWIEARDLEEDDRLVFEPPVAHRIPAAQISFRDQNTHHFSRSSSFPSIWSGEVGAVLGYLLGDGCMTSGKYPTVSVVFSEQDKDAALQLQKIVNSWVDTNTQLRGIEENRDSNSLVGEIYSRQYALHWRVKSLAEFLTSLGFDKSVGCDNLRAPKGLWQAGTEAVRGFLSGLFGADGSVGRSGKKIEVSMASTSIGLLQDAQQLLFAFFGIRSTMSTYSSNEKRGYKPLYKLCINSDHHVRKFATDVSFFTPRKQELLIRLCRELPEAAVTNRYPVVKSVKKVSDKIVPVYDLQVDIDHAFVANNVTIHNCYALKAAYGYTSNVVGQSMKLELTRRWLKSGEFVSRMIDFIRAGQINSAERMKKTPREFWHDIPNPNFFRIHDAGDMFKRSYSEAWIEICGKLPDVQFWAPTRMWAMEGAAALRFGKGLPPNLALRPSSLHFKTAAPDVKNAGTLAATLYGIPFPGVAAGSGSGLTVPKGAWACPAYEHTTKLGGAVFKLSPKGKVIGTKGGNCGRAHGPNSPGRGGNDPSDLPTSEGGNGCRACWRNKDLPIFYHEH